MIDISREVLVCRRTVWYCSPCDSVYVSVEQVCPHCGDTSGYACTDASDVPLDADSPEGREYCDTLGVAIND